MNVKTVIFYSVFGFTMIFFLVLLVAVSEKILDTTGIKDPPNISTLLVEVTLGILITLMVYSSSTRQQKRMTSLLQETKNQQDKITKLIENIEKIEKAQHEIIEEQNSFSDKRRNYSVNMIDSNLIMIDYHITRIKDIVSYPRNDQNDIEKEIKYNLDEKNYYVNQIEMITNLSSDVLDPALVLEILDVCRIAKLYVLYDKDGNPFNFPNITSIHTSIEKLRKELPPFSI